MSELSNFAKQHPSRVMEILFLTLKKIDINWYLILTLGYSFRTNPKGDKLFRNICIKFYREYSKCDLLEITRKLLKDRVPFRNTKMIIYHESLCIFEDSNNPILYDWRMTRNLLNTWGYPAVLLEKEQRPISDTMNARNLFNTKVKPPTPVFNPILLCNSTSYIPWTLQDRYKYQEPSPDQLLDVNEIRKLTGGDSFRIKI